MALDSSDMGSITRAIVDLGAQDDQAAEKIWRRFFQQLGQYVETRIGQRHRRHFDEQDVVNSAFFVLFDGIKKGRFAQLCNRDELWQLLTLIAARKACNARKFFDRKKRGGGKVLGGSALSAVARDQLVGFLTTAAQNDNYEHLEKTSDDMIRALPDESLRRIALLRLAGHSNSEIASQMGCVTRTVERKLHLIRLIWGREIET